MRKMLANVAMAMVLVMGMAVNTEAGSLENKVFGQRPETTVSQSSSCKLVNLQCFDEGYYIMTDTDVEPLFGLPLELAKYGFVNHMLGQVEVNFKDSNLINFQEIHEKLVSKYGKVNMTGDFDPTGNKIDIAYVWRNEDKVVALSYVEARSTGYKNLSLIIQGKDKVKVIR